MEHYGFIFSICNDMLPDLFYLKAENSSCGPVIRALLQVAQSFFDALYGLFILIAGERSLLKSSQSVSDDFQKVIITESVCRLSSAAGALLEAYIAHYELVFGIQHSVEMVCAAVVRVVSGISMV